MSNEMNNDAFAERIARPLRAAEHADATFEARAMSAVHAAARAREPNSLTHASWWTRRRTVSMSPLAALAAAAAFAALLLGGSSLVGRSSVSAPAVAARDTVHIVRFVLVEPGARRVALVGGFNGWSKEATLLQDAGANGVWTVDVPLAAGRHEYAFVVIDERGERWIADPATLPKRDEFGTESSVLSIGRNSTS